MNKSKKWISLILAMVLILSLGISAYAEDTCTAETSPLDALEFTLPDGITLRQYSESQETFVKDSAEAGDDAAEVGGVFLLDYEGESTVEEASDNPLEPLLSLVLSAMQEEKDFEAEWYMGGSSLYGPIEVSMGNDQAEYTAYVVQTEGAWDVYCVVWFDDQQISGDDKVSIMQSLSDPGFADYTLPEGYSLAEITDSSCSLVKDGQTVGGFAITELELESLEDWNDEDIFPPRLIQYLEEDLPDTVTDEYMIEGWNDYITVVYVLNDTETGERQEYLHYFFERDNQVWEFWINRDEEDNLLPTEMGISSTAVNG